MAITIDSLLAGRRYHNIKKSTATTEGAGTFFSLWKITGNPAAGATPTAFGSGGLAPDRTTAGALGQLNANVSEDLFLTSFKAFTPLTTGGVLVLYDRLWTCSGFATNIITTQTVASPAAFPTARLRDGSSDYSDCELWGEVYTAPGATGATWTAVCPDGGGTNQNWTYTHPANAETVGQMFPFVPAAGSAAGCRTPVSFTASISSGTAGDIGFTVLRRIAEIPLSPNLALFNGFDLGLPEIKDGACLAFMIQAGGSGSGDISGSVSFGSVVP